MIGATKEGSLRQGMEAERRQIEAAAIAAANEATAATKADLRAVTKSAIPGKGGRHLGAIRSRVYVDEVAGTKKAAGAVYSTLGRGRGSDFVDYLASHARGGTLLPKASGDGDAGRFLVLPFGGRRLPKGKRLLDGLGTDKSLALVPISGGRFMLVKRAGMKKDGSFRAGARTQVLAILVRKVTLRPRIDLDGVQNRSATAMVRSLAGRLGGSQ